MRLVGWLRRKYGRGALRLRILGSPSLLVLGAAGIRRILDGSPWAYADPRPKREGMSHFAPGAVTISRGAEWQDRRRFNEAVLETGSRVHSGAEGFLALVQDEVRAVAVPGMDTLVWQDFDRLFERLALGVVLGRTGRDDTALTGRLRAMMRESNRIFGLSKSGDFDAFYAGLRTRLERAEAGSLAAFRRATPATAETRVENQVPHWLFAIRETLAANTVAALALIVSHPRVHDRVRAEISGALPLTPDGVDRLRYLEGCVQEAMRLWPTTPELVREALSADTLEGAKVEPGLQVVILNTFNHRDRAAHPFADRFTPEHWLDRDTDELFNHLSNGPQACAGKPLALFLAKAILAELLQTRTTLVAPELDPEEALPRAFDPFRARFHRHAA